MHYPPGAPGTGLGNTGGCLIPGTNGAVPGTGADPGMGTSKGMGI